MNTIPTQQDTKVRMVALVNLEAMCAHVSGVMCHTFRVVKVSRSRVHVEYSNENEYACAEPMTAVFPCFPSDWPGDEANPRVLLEYLRIIGDRWDGEGWQAFEVLRDCPTLWRAPGIEGWQTEAAIKAQQAVPSAAPADGGRATCRHCGRDIERGPDGAWWSVNGDNCPANALSETHEPATPRTIAGEGERS